MPIPHPLPAPATEADQDLGSVSPPRSHPAPWLDGVKQGMLIGLAILVVMPPPWRSVAPASGSPAVSASRVFAPLMPRQADFGQEVASQEARHIADWVVNSNDNRELYFVILDKLNTKVFVFSPTGALRGATPVLIGAAKGDDSVIGIGGRRVADVREHERTTPAGRFQGEPGHNTQGEDVVWVDYDAAVSMHRVRTVEPKERRLERLASPTTADNRISYGCINMPVDFYQNVLKPAFDARYGVVYVLPEIKNIRDVFPAAYGAVTASGAIPPS